MTKRSREDFDPSSPEPQTIGGTLESDPSVSQAGSATGAVKIIHLDEPDRGSGVPSSTTEMLCSLPGHRQTLSFASYEEYEVHYTKTHLNRCLECRKNLPTEHFLNLHIEENHDALVSVRRERGEKTYSCFVEDCDRKCSTPQKRRMHLIDKHMFPKDYDYYVVNNGIDHRISMLVSGRHRRKSSAAHHMAGTDQKVKRESVHGGSSQADITEDASQPKSPKETKVTTPPSYQEDADMDGLAGAMSSLKFVPPSVRFGHRGRGRGRGGFSRT